MHYALRRRALVTGGARLPWLAPVRAAAAARRRRALRRHNFIGTKDNIVHLLDNPHFELIRHDVTFPLYVEVDEIYNLACPAWPIHYQHDPVQTTKTSVQTTKTSVQTTKTSVHGAINMLGLAKRVKAKIFQASTSEVYGDPEVHPQTEDYWGRVNPIGTRACYDEGKRCAETLFFDYHRQHHPIRAQQFREVQALRGTWLKELPKHPSERDPQARTSQPVPVWRIQSEP
jgi:UDP-glucuronate decarboxylase